jgi:glycosyltransferase involved in cell wall biosynthesis
MQMHYHDPNKKRAHVLVFYRDFKDYGGDDYGNDEYGSEGGYGHCHRGLGINALLTVKVLRKHGIRADLAAVHGINDVRKELTKHCPTHAIIQALWITAEQQASLCADFPQTHFVVRCHSQIGFLQVEPNAIKILRDLLFLQEGLLNLSVSSNTYRLQEFLHHSYKSKVLYLPNLYDLERVSRKRDESHGHRVLRVGSFGAHRLLKNHTTAAAAAMMMAERRGSDLEFYVNAGREENIAKNSVLKSLRFMLDRVRWAKLVEVGWEEWSQFKQTVAHMDLCLQPSFTETFNIVTADAAAEGVPSVVSEAIEWVPHRWKAAVDDAADIARVGSNLLWDIHGADEGLQHLEKYCKEGIHAWLQYLDSNPTI